MAMGLWSVIQEPTLRGLERKWHYPAFGIIHVHLIIHKLKEHSILNGETYPFIIFVSLILSNTVLPILQPTGIGVKDAVLRLEAWH